MCHNLPCYSTVIVSRLWLVTQNLWSRGLATRNNNRTRNPIVNCNVSGCTSWNRVMVSSHSDGGRKGTYARLKYIRENICYGRDEKWILFLKAMGRFFFCVWNTAQVWNSSASNVEHWKRRQDIQSGMPLSLNFLWESIGWKLQKGFSWSRIGLRNRLVEGVIETQIL